MILSKIKAKLKSNIQLIIKGIKSLFLSPAERRNNRYYRYYRHKRLKKNTVFYESFYGRGMLCGPYALFCELANNPEYKRLKHVWVLDDPKNHTDLIKRSKKQYPGIKFVKFGSKKYLKYLASAKYLVNNVTFYAFFVKRPGQVYVNTWHGIPLKHLGFDEPTGSLNAFNMTRNFLHADYLISANPFLTDIYLDAYKLRGLAETKIIEEGYPRLDTLVNTKKEAIYEELERSGVKVDPNKKIILYAPTWKGASYAAPDTSVNGFVELKEKLCSMIDTSKYQVLVKVHQVVYSLIREQLSEYDYVVPATMDANVILGITDILISDYSSIYYDFLATNRPVLFYINDIESYTETRGVYSGLESLPGPYTDDLTTLGNWINNIDSVFEENKDKYNKIKDWCCDYNIGSISKKIAGAIWGGNWKDVKVVECCTEKKKKVLISKGPMLVNGISTAMLNLLKQFDYDKYDVTVLVEDTNKAEQREKILQIDNRARTLVRSKMYLKTAFGGMRNVFFMQKGPINSFWKMVFPKKVYTTEFRRIYGESKFDYIIDYEGYNIFYANLCLAQPGAKTCIWMHNDMVSEYEVRFKWLTKIFALYNQFDKTVSCSKQIMEVNRVKLADKVPYEKFYYAKNTVNFDNVINGVKNGKVIKNGDRYFYGFTNTSGVCVNMQMIPLQPEKEVQIDNTTMTISASNQKVENGITRFVTIGRLSPEKNQEELINAFARLVKDNPDVMLYILGNGPLKKNLENQISGLNLSDKVILTGNLSNPFGLLAQGDCFILPSIHEGQPLVVFEARVCHLPIIISDFSSVGGSLIENGQLVIQKDADSIYEGMKAFLDGKVPSDYTFDHENYNREAYKEFEEAVFN